MPKKMIGNKTTPKVKKGKKKSPSKRIKKMNARMKMGDSTK